MFPEEAGQRLALLERFQQQHRTGILTLLFTDLVDSTRLKQELGDTRAVGLTQRHHVHVREWLKAFPEAQEIETAGDSFLLVFARPSDPVRFALGLQVRNRHLSAEAAAKIEDRVGIHAGEVFVHDQAGDAKLFGSQVDLCGRRLNMASGGQVLLTRFINDVRVVAAQKRAADQIHQFIRITYSGTLGVTGVVFLLWTAIVMLTRVEETFNDIWGVTRGRNWLSRIVLYWATISLGPILLIAALGLATGQRFPQTREMLFVVPYREPLVSQLLPVVLICFTFSMLYKLVPNTKVHFTAAFAGGTFAGVAWCLFNLISLHFATSAVTASVIYGSLALVPLLRVGLYAVWAIVLFGAQVAYAFQNRESYLQERLAENVNQRGREFVALRLMTCIGQRFDRSLPPPTISEMSHELGIPSKLIQQVLQTLLAARLVVEVAGGESGYVPARPLEAINCHHVLLAMRATQGQELRTREEPARAEVYGEFARIQAAEKEAASAVSMLALVHRAQSRPELAPPAVAAAAPEAAPTPAVTELPFEPKPSGPPLESPLSKSEPIEMETLMATAAVSEPPPANQCRLPYRRGSSTG